MSNSTPEVIERELFIPSIATRLTEGFARFKRLLDRIKFIGSILIIVTTVLSLSIGISLREWNRMNAAQCVNTTDCIVLYVGPDSICDFTKQFDLPNEYKLSICSGDKLDLRRYVNGQSSGQGININRRQFEYILRISSFVFKELNKINRDQIY